MKKKVIMASAAVIMSAVAVGFGVNSNSKMTDLMSANLEALSNDEFGNRPITCYEFYEYINGGRCNYCVGNGNCRYLNNVSPNYSSAKQCFQLVY